MTLPRAILVPTDFSEHADHALDYAVELAARLDATVHLVHAIVVPAAGELAMAYATVMESATSGAQTALADLVDRHRDKARLAAVRVEIGDARDVIDRTAAAIGADLIVMGTHGRRGISRVLLGSVAESVVRSAPCPVLTVRRKHS